MGRFEYFDSVWDWIDYVVYALVKVFISAIVIAFFPSKVIMGICLYWIFKSVIKDIWEHAVWLKERAVYLKNKK